MGSRRLRLFCAALAAAVAGALIPAVAAHATSPSGPTAPPGPAGPAGHAACPVLVLSAMPVELGPLLARANVDPNPAWVHDGRGFWAGTLEGNRVVMALSGIGIVNATNTTEAAFSHFGCFSAVVFSGTSGGDYIGDVMVPARWTLDGKTFLPTSTAALDVLRTALQKPPALEQTTPAGDPFCVCGVTSGLPSAQTPVSVEHQPQVEVGGDAVSNDGFGNRALPCSVGVSDTFGCWPCPFPDTAVATQTANLATTVPPFLDPSFITGYETASAPPPGNYVSQDMETAAVFTVAAVHRVPFIGFRSASDGGGDPLMLPGFPAEFFFYRQLAADNAGTVALAFLRAWASRLRPGVPVPVAALS